MNLSIERVLRLFSSRSCLVSGTTKGSVGNQTDEIIWALQKASHNNPLGLQYLMADYLNDKAATQYLHSHFERLVGIEVAPYAVSFLLQRPLPEQLNSLVSVHPYYIKERRRAAKVLSQADLADDEDINHKRLKAEQEGILQAARSRCLEDILSNGRCPKCQGTGKRIRLGRECEQCSGSGRIVLDRAVMARKFGVEIKHKVDRAIDEIHIDASELTTCLSQHIKKLQDTAPNI